MPGKRGEEESDRDAKRARPVLTTERFMSEAPTVIQSLSDLVSKLASDSDEIARKLCSAAETLQTGRQCEIRSLCRPWGVTLTEKKATGKTGKRKDAELIADLTPLVIEKATEYLRAATCRTPQPASVSIATELASDEFSFEDVAAEALHRIRESIKESSPAARIMARIVERW